MQIHKRLKISHKECVGASRPDEGFVSPALVWLHVGINDVVSHVYTEEKRSTGVKESAPLKHTGSNKSITDENHC